MFRVDWTDTTFLISFQGDLISSLRTILLYIIPVRVWQRLSYCLIKWDYHSDKWKLNYICLEDNQIWFIFWKIKICCHILAYIVFICIVVMWFLCDNFICGWPILWNFDVILLPSKESAYIYLELVAPSILE